MTPLRRHLLPLGLVALVATLSASAQPAQTLPPGFPGQATPAAEKKSDANNSPAAPATSAPTPAPAATDPNAKASTDAAPATAEKSPAPASTKTKSLFTLPAALPKTGPTPPPLSPRFLQVREKIDKLFGPRNSPPPPPDPRLNPFRPPGAVPVAPIATKDGVIEPVAVSNNLALLQQAVATIRVKGTVTRNKILQLVINTGPGKEGTYKEGDIININLAPDPVHLRVRVITRSSVSLTLGDAEMSMNF